MKEKGTPESNMRDNRESMEKGLLEKEREEIRDGFSGAIRFDVLVEEVKQLGYIAGPMVAVNLSQYFLQIISIMMVGHLGKLSLSSTAIAISFCAVCGFSLLLLTLLSGFLLNPELETSVLSVCLSTLTTLYTIPDGLGAAHKSFLQFRRRLLYAQFSLAAEYLLVIFSNEKEVVGYVASMVPLVCLAVIFDSVQGVRAGIARGCGWQDLGAFVNLGAYYFIGIPVSAVLGFWLNLRGKGLWIGILVSSIVQTFLLSVLTFCTNWEKKARMARERIFEGRFFGDKRSIEERNLLS